MKKYGFGAGKKRRLKPSRQAGCGVDRGLQKVMSEEKPSASIEAVALRRLLTNDNLTDGEYTYLTPN